MRLFGKDLSQQVAVIAEVGVNHEGDFEAAMKLLRLAAESGADAVKFQSYNPDRYVTSSDEARHERVSKFQLSEESHHELSEEAKRLGVEFFSTPLTEDMVPYLAELCPAIKIASGDLTFEPLIRAAGRSSKPILLSTGLGTAEEIDRAVGWLKDEIGEADLANRLAIMHCVSAYPTPIEEANVRAIPFLAERYNLTVGYSNHVVGAEACLAAVALGASVLEVHFTDERENREFRDHHISFLPAELKQLVESSELIRKSLGQYDKTPMPSELPNRQAIRKGVAASRDLPPGHCLEEADLMYVRPATEFDSSELPSLTGKTLKVEVRSGQLIPRNGIQ